jgi:hypothetical protein
MRAVRGAYRYALWCSFLAAIIIVGIGIAVWSDASQDVISVDAMHDCAQEGDGGPFDVSCIRAIVIAALKTQPAHEIVAEAEKAFPKNCHIIGHIVGEEAYRSSSSIETAYESCMPVSCVNACVHGVGSESFREVAAANGVDLASDHPNMDMILDDGRELCRKTGTCHGVGHVLMYLKNDLSFALTMCDTIGGDNAEACYRGVFMEDASRTVAITARVVSDADRTTYIAATESIPCGSVAAKYQPACYRFAHFYLVPAGGGFRPEAFSELVAACSQIPRGLSREECFFSTGWTLYDGNSIDQALDACATLSVQGDRKACANGTSNFYADHGNAFEIIRAACPRQRDPEIVRECYRGLFLVISNRDIPDVLCVVGDDLCEEARKEFISVR